jgi:hypothetical protein
MFILVARALYGVLHDTRPRGCAGSVCRGLHGRGLSNYWRGARDNAVSDRGVRHHDRTSIASFSEASEPESLFPKKEARFGSGLKGSKAWGERLKEEILSVL